MKIAGHRLEEILTILIRCREGGGGGGGGDILFSNSLGGKNCPNS